MGFTCFQKREGSAVLQHGIDRAVIADDQNGFLVEILAEIGGDAVDQILRQAHEAQEDAVLIDVGAVLMDIAAVGHRIGIADPIAGADVGHHGHEAFRIEFLHLAVLVGQADA